MLTRCCACHCNYTTCSAVLRSRVHLVVVVVLSFLILCGVLRVIPSWRELLTSTTAGVFQTKNSVHSSLEVTNSTTNHTGSGGENNHAKLLPNGLRIAFAGDSITRFTYLSLTYFLTHGNWAPDDNSTLRMKHSFNRWVASTNQYLAPYEACDCFHKTYRIECHYYYDSSTNGNNSISYFGKFGNQPFLGHWNASSVQFVNPAPTTKDSTIPPFQPGLLQSKAPPVWMYNWNDFVDYYLADLSPRPSILIFNEGLWPDHGLQQREVLLALKGALKRQGIRGIYRTTTFGKYRKHFETDRYGDLHKHDIQACELFDCWNVSWTADVSELEHTDDEHFKAHVYNRMIRQFFQEKLNLILKEDYSQDNNDRLP